MRLTCSVSVPLMAAALLVAGCAEPGHRSGGGVLITNDGRVIPNTDVNARAETERAIVASLQEALGSGWTAEAALQDLPDLHGDRLQGTPEWRWSAARATITLRGTGTPPVAPDEVKAAVTRYLTKKLADRAPGPVEVTVTVTAPSPEPVATAAPAAPAAAASGRTYVVQAGDTWADLSTAFYGAPEGWRTIRDANGGSERPVAGATVVIPAR